MIYSEMKRLDSFWVFLDCVTPTPWTLNFDLYILYTETLRGWTVAVAIWRPNRVQPLKKPHNAMGSADPEIDFEH